MYGLKSDIFYCEYEPEKLSLKVFCGGEKFCWNQSARIVLSGGEELYFKDAKCEHAHFKTGVTEGVKAVYSDFGGLDITIFTSVSIDEYEGLLRFEVRAEGRDEMDIAELFWPCGFCYASDSGYTIIPRMQGILIPARSEQKIPNGFIKGMIYDRDAYMPMFGQKKVNAGYLAIYDTQFDAMYRLVHVPGDDTTVEPLFIPSLGSVSDKRIMLYNFYEVCDYNLFAKEYRRYLKETGRFITLREKIARNENVARLIGTPIIHDIIVKHICEGTYYYDKEHPENNDACYTFELRANQLRELKKKGLERAYLHFDGWGKAGYDNQHPDIFPPNEQAGGAEGMRKLCDTAKELGYIFGIHDQYRDYYYDAETFDFANAVTYKDGTHPYCDLWNGGKHTCMCQALSPEYVRRNFKRLENLGINVEAAYLDVFSIVPLDECFNPDHRLTRKQCAEKRNECFEILTAKGIIPSSEEAMDCCMRGIALCHHAPYFAYSSLDEESPEGEKKNVMFGIAIPLFNLVWHESLIVPWTMLNDDDPDRWEGVPSTDSPYLYAILNGGSIYLSIEATEADLERSKPLLELHSRVALCEMVSHEFLGGGYRRQKTVFSDGTEVTVDFDKKTFDICYKS